MVHVDEGVYDSVQSTAIGLIGSSEIDMIRRWRVQHSFLVYTVS